ncbi:MAG: DUF58 domain-containing protein [Clostridiales bacterium]|nr:DUF58 domain-containing protein [Clostridiales bacterium]
MILLIAVFAVVLYYAEKYSLKHVLDQVTFCTSLDKVVVEPGEVFSWSMTIRNGKRMMVPYLRLREHVPEELVFADGSGKVGEKWYSWLVSTLYLGRHQKVVLKREVSIPKRGRYFFHGASVDAGDFLGIRSVTDTYSEMHEIVVKPQRYPLSELTELLGGYLGENSVRKSLMEDPIEIIGFREYTGREPFRTISWTQSARYSRLLVKQYENTTEFSCTVLLNTDCSKQMNQGTLLEQCFSIVRSVCEMLEKQKISYDFRTNGCIAGPMGDWNHIRDGLGVSHLEAVLEGLGRMTYDTRESEADFWEKEIRIAQNNKSIILVTPTDGETARAAAARFEKKSQKKVLLLCADTICS